MWFGLKDVITKDTLWYPVINHFGDNRIAKFFSAQFSNRAKTI